MQLERMPLSSGDDGRRKHGRLFRRNQSSLPIERLVFTAAKHPNIVVASRGRSESHPNDVKVFGTVAASDSLD